MNRHNILYTIFSLFFSLLFVVSIHAQDYILELHQIEATDEARLKPSISRERMRELETQGFTVLPPISKVSDIYFQIDRTDVAFQNLSDGGSFIEKVMTDVKNVDSSPFQLYIKLLSNLSSIGDQTIEPTNCDHGCSIRIAKPWESETIYGWGFSTDEGKTYRSFTDRSGLSLYPENPLTSKISLTFKIQTPPKQPEGNFQGVVQLIALPNL